MGRANMNNIKSFPEQIPMFQRPDNGEEEEKMRQAYFFDMYLQGAQTY